MPHRRRIRPDRPSPAGTIRPSATADRDGLARLADAALFLDAGDGSVLADLFVERSANFHTVGLVAVFADELVGAAFGSAYGERGFIDFFAVDEPVRGRGAATALFDRLEAALVSRGATSLQLGGNGHFYAWPGIDVGYSAALAFAEQRGYRERERAVNLEVPLQAWQLGTTALRDSTVNLRRASSSDWPALRDYVEREFSTGWRDEAARALHRPVPTVFVATRGKTIVGFACHGVYRPDWFGPIGTSASERGNGIGEALLRACLDDLAQAGVEPAQIAWVGPTAFYVRTVSARPGRRFVILAKSAKAV